jgi:hypothetical protein
MFNIIKEFLTKNFLFVILLYFLTILTGIMNNGIFAVDDFISGVSKIVPAQQKSYQHVIDNSGIRSPIPKAYLLTISKVSYLIGIENPLKQVSFIYSLNGIINVTLIFFGLVYGFRKKIFAVSERSLLLMFTFLTPALLIYTRIMLESLSLPWLTLFVIFLAVFEKNKETNDLLLSMFVLTVASVMRPQTGLLIIFPLYYLARNFQLKQFLVFCVFSLFCFVLSGLPDLYWYGEFHGKLKEYVDYCINYSSNYGVMNPFVYLYLFLGLSLAPLLVYKWDSKLLQNLKQHKVFISCLLLFTVAHSFVPHKEERFMFPVLGVFIISISPIIEDLFNTKRYIRLGVFSLLHFLLCLLTIFQVTQNNLIKMVEHLHENKTIQKVTYFNDSLTLIPEAYFEKGFSFNKVAIEKLDENSKKLTCSDALVFRKDYKNKLPERFYNEFVQKGEFHPGFLEKIVIKFNYKYNMRRDSLYLFQKKGCS